MCNLACDSFEFGGAIFRSQIYLYLGHTTCTVFVSATGWKCDQHYQQMDQMDATKRCWISSALKTIRHICLKISSNGRGNIQRIIFNGWSERSSRNTHCDFWQLAIATNRSFGLRPTPDRQSFVSLFRSIPYFIAKLGAIDTRRMDSYRWKV